MTELIERYIHQVGRYLPLKERGEIEAELRSQIQDKLDDRYEGSPSQDDVASVLSELGEPHKIATSYGGDQYLIGPDIYPFMMMVLRHGWLIVPGIVVFLNVFGALVSSQPTTLITVILETIWSTIQVTLIFSAVVVLFFAIIQHANVEFDENKQPFNPLELPEVDDPGVVDRVESAFGIAFGTIFTLVFLYFLRVGGLTLRINPSNPGEVITVPTFWMILLILVAVSMVVIHLLVLRRNRWGIRAWIIETLLELVGAISMYFVVYKPIYERIITDHPNLADVIIIQSIPEIIAIGYAVLTLINKGIGLIKLWNYRNNNPPPYATN